MLEFIHKELLMTHEDKKNEIVIYQPDEIIRLEVMLQNETVWLNQNKLSMLFDVDRTVINKHIRNIFLFL